jgi:hypothetical protein
MRAHASCLALVLAGCSAPGSVRPAAQASTLFEGGLIHPEAGSAPLTALRASDGWVVELERRGAGPTTVIDLRGGVAVPGLQDAHGHLEGLGEMLESVDLAACPSFEELIERVAERAARQPPGTWILGRGWDQTLWPGREFPHHAALSARVGEHPVCLERVDGHAVLVNARALAVAGLENAAALPAIEGGRIHVDAQGRPSGVLVDAATELVARHIPAPDRAARERRLLAAQELLLSQGLTCVHDMGTSEETLAVLAELEHQGRLRLRVICYLWANDGLSPAELALLDPARDSDPTRKLRVLGAKLMADGALGSRGAALLEPYADAPGELGLLQLAPEALAERLREALAAGLQPATHAIGDRGNRLILDLYERELRERPELARLRPRVEHAQVVAEADRARFGLLGVIPSVQPTHATSDMRWAEARLGAQRLSGAYAWLRLSGARAPLALGSDFPVESSSPLLGLYAARTRQDPQGSPPGGWLADQRLDARAALAGFTSGAAFAAREEATRGRLHPGYRADLTVLDVDSLQASPGELLRARVLLTVIDGEVVYAAPPQPGA